MNARSALAPVLTALALGTAACGDSPAHRETTRAATAAAVQVPAQGAARTAAGHPRLLVRRSDLPRLRRWASGANPLWAKGLRVLAAEAKADMDAGRVPGGDRGSDAYDEHTTEAYAQLFAFLSLVEPRAGARADYGRRARSLLMAVLREAARGRGEQDERWRDPDFSTGDRSRWHGEAFPLTVDWAYPYFSGADKRVIRKVFLRWSREQFDGYPMTSVQGGRRPLPGGRPRDPGLIADRRRVRWSLNNYAIAHARNLGLMSLALDARDDPGGRLRRHLRDVTGQWLFVTDHALRTDARGGLSPEGFNYGPDALGRLAQLHTALRTAGRGGEAFAANPFWRDALPAFLHSLPQRPTRPTGDSAWLGQVWLPAWYGDALHPYVEDPIPLFGPLALDAAARGDTRTVEAIRWIQTHVPPGGAPQLLERVGNTDQFFGAILYFLLFDPAAAPPADPRPQLPLHHVAEGLNRTLARTCWCSEGRLFAHKLSWNALDHQIGDGNDIALARNGEWLTRQRTQYASGYSDYTNTLAVANDPPEHNDEGDPRRLMHERGLQWELDPAGDPAVPARSFGDGYVAITGDATNLYNSDYEDVHDARHVSRSVVWLQPDHVVAYDRATTGKEGRFKRFWLQLPSAARIDGRRATARTAGGQQLAVTSLLPERAALTTAPNETEGEPTEGDPMRHRLRIEDPSAPRDVRFLTVLQGADGDATPDAVTRLRSRSGTPYDGAVVAGQAVLFPVQLGGRVEEVAVEVPADGLRRVLVTG
ncbi:MAG TPA: hypothetical protein VD931_16645, partial [Baekduia sp.]|nr:hypothetical protein [Baekduia sp.]